MISAQWDLPSMLLGGVYGFLVALIFIFLAILFMYLTKYIDKKISQWDVK